MNAQTKTLLSLEQWADIIGLNPWFAAQVSTGFPEGYLARTGCKDVMFRNSAYALDNLSRNEVADAILTAEDMWAEQTGFWPAPKYIEGETIPYPQMFQADFRSGIFTLAGHLKTVNTEYKYIKSVGVMTRVELEAGASCVYTDPSSDTLNELVTITSAAAVPTGTVADEIHIYFTSTDRLGQDYEIWEINPIDVSINSTTSIATITCHRWQMVKPVLTLGSNPQELDVSVAGNFVTEVDIYREYMDLSQAGSLIWENVGNCDDPPCSTTIQAGCFGTVNADEGVIAPQAGTWDSTNTDWDAVALVEGRAPDRVAVNYLAGYPLKNGRMDRLIALAITKLSVTLIAKRKCGCNRAQANFDNWQSFPGEGKEDRRRIVTSMKHIDSPWGPKVGAIEAWETAINKIKWGATSYGKGKR